MEVSYFGLDSIQERSKCEKLFKEYKRGKTELGKGAYGKVYDLCKGTNCNFVLKVTTFSKEYNDRIGGYKSERSTKFNEWMTEIENNLKVVECRQDYEFQFIPRIYDAWFCDKKNGDTKFYIIFERFEGNLKEFINKFSNVSKEVKMLLKTFIFLKFEILKNTLIDIVTFDIEYYPSENIVEINFEHIFYKLNENGTYELVFPDSIKLYDVERLIQKIENEF
jgi:hypothetical protein